MNYDSNIKTKSRYNQNLLTGCLTLIDSKFMWQGKCEISNNTLERVQNYKKPK